MGAHNTKHLIPQQSGLIQAMQPSNASDWRITPQMDALPAPLQRVEACMQPANE
jgi:hypothetical protein